MRKLKKLDTSYFETKMASRKAGIISERGELTEN